MNTTPIKKSRSGKIRHLLGVTAVSLQSLTITRKKGFRCGALILLLTCGFLFAMDGAGLARERTHFPTDCADAGVTDVFVFSGTAGYEWRDPNRVRLTGSTRPGWGARDQAGAVTAKNKIDFRHPFTIAFQANFGHKYYGKGNHGMAVVFHNDPRGRVALGRHGAALGAGGIQNGIALEIDTHIDSFENWDTDALKKRRKRRQKPARWEDHTSIWDTDGGLRDGMPRSYLTTAIGHGDLDDWARHDVEISWDPATATLSYTLDGNPAGSYTHRRGMADFVTAYFDGAYRVHFGITAGTEDFPETIITSSQSIHFQDFCWLHFRTDSDRDGVDDIDDIDDDNDGITDCVENGLEDAQGTNVFALSGSAKPIYMGRFIQVSITQDLPQQAGAAMSRHKIDFRKPFTIAFQAHFGDEGPKGADGMAVVFHNDPRGSAALGRPGAALGAGGLQNGIALEFDTYRNDIIFEGFNSTLWDDHASIWDTDGVLHPEGAPPFYLARASFIGRPHNDVEDGEWHYVEVTWDPAVEGLAYYIDGAVVSFYRHHGATDFVTEYFGGANRVYFGVTAATGDLTNGHSIRFMDYSRRNFDHDFDFDFCSLPVGRDPDGDGRLNHVDLDSDGDGAWDIEESGADHATLDVNNDGEIDVAFPDTDGDGLSQEIEAANGENSGTTPRDTNDDGIPDFLDPEES